MESFYGGKQGLSFNIVKSYKSVEEMKADFAKGENCPVHYEEYVIINAENKSNSEHGNLYQRKANGGSRYICNISGPIGPAPVVKFDSYGNLMKNNKAESIQLNYGSELIPGYSEDKSGTLRYYSTVDTVNNSSTVTVGLQLPYNYVDVSAEMVDMDDIPIGYKLDVNKFEYNSFTGKEGQIVIQLPSVSNSAANDKSRIMSSLVEVKKGQSFNNVDGKYWFRVLYFRDGQPYTSNGVDEETGTNWKKRITFESNETVRILIRRVEDTDALQTMTLDEITESFYCTIPDLNTSTRLSVLSERVDDETKPFYHKYKIKVPYTTIKNIRIYGEDKTDDLASAQAYLQYLQSLHSIGRFVPVESDSSSEQFTQEFKATKEYSYYQHMVDQSEGKKEKIQFEKLLVADIYVYELNNTYTLPIGLFKLNAPHNNFIIGAFEDDDIEEKKANLSVGGIWFVTSNESIKVNDPYSNGESVFY